MIYSCKERCELLGEYLCAHGATVRTVARVFAVSKSTVHKDVTVRLRYTNPTLYAAVKGVLEQNKQERHLRGGEATRKKYLLRQGRVAESKEESKDSVL